MLVGDDWISIGREPRTHCHVDTYMQNLTTFALDKQCFGGISFLEYLKVLQQRDEDPEGYMYKIYLKRICELEDSDSLLARLRTLELLVVDGKMDPPIALDVIRFRQCGFLRRLVERNILKLESEASSDPQFNAPTWRKLKFLGGKKLLGSVQIGVLLCFAAVEFDDLQSLQWIVERNLFLLENQFIHGLNLAHASACFGRLEILVWLSTQTAWKTMIAAECSRAPFQKTKVAQIAVIQGHINAAQLALGLGAPDVDGNNWSCYECARKSNFEYVRKLNFSLVRVTNTNLNRQQKNAFRLPC